MVRTSMHLIHHLTNKENLNQKQTVESAFFGGFFIEN